jgi:hypothetical protein
LLRRKHSRSRRLARLRRAARPRRRSTAKPRRLGPCSLWRAMRPKKGPSLLVPRRKTIRNSAPRRSRSRGRSCSVRPVCAAVASRPRSGCGPSGAVASGRGAHPCSSSGPGTHGCDAACVCWAGRFVSSWPA